MVTVGVDKARTEFAGLLQRVSKGESITITKHGVPLAKLIPAQKTASPSIEETIDALLKHRTKTRLKGLPIREMIEEGRR